MSSGTNDVEEVECEHRDVYFEAGNYIPPYGWETYPGWFCEDCGQEIEMEDDRD